MTRCLVGLTLLLAACGGSTGPSPKSPAPLDPTVLVMNHLPGRWPAAHGDTVTLTWQDQSGQIAVFRVAPQATACTHFTALLPTDSVRYLVQFGDSAANDPTSPTYDPAHPAWAFAGPSIWFLPSAGDHDNWTVTARDGGILMLEVAQVPC